MNSKDEARPSYCLSLCEVETWVHLALELQSSDWVTFESTHHIWRISFIYLQTMWMNHCIIWPPSPSFLRSTEWSCLTWSLGSQTLSSLFPLGSMLGLTHFFLDLSVPRNACFPRCFLPWRWLSFPHLMAASLAHPPGLTPLFPPRAASH